MTGDGACPDNYVNSGDESITVTAMSQDNGLTQVEFSRPLATGETADIDTPANGNMYVVWAMGVLSATGLVTYHSQERLQGDCTLSCDSYTACSFFLMK